MEQTTAELNVREIQTVGAGRDAGVAGRPLTLDVGRYRVAVLSYLAMDSTLFFAGASTPGAAAWSGSVSERQIGEAAGAADIVVVCLHIHIGPSWVDGLQPRSMSIVEGAMDAGADIVLVSGSHIAQGVMVRDGRIALLGLGDFLFQPDYPVPLEARHSLLARLTVDARHIGVSLVPLLLDGRGRPVPASSEEAVSSLTWLARVSAWLGTTVTESDGVGFMELERATRDADARAIPEPGADIVLQGAGA